MSNPTATEYIRNCLKRVRKKESAMLLASQNLEDFDQEGIREMTKPLFSIPPHQFLFNAGSIDKRSYMEMLQLVSVCTSAATSATCWRYTPLHTRKSCLARRVVADGSICRHDRKSRGDSAL